MGRRCVFRKTSRVAHDRPTRPAEFDIQRRRHAKTRGVVNQTSDASMHGSGRLLSKDPVAKVWEESEVSIQGRRYAAYTSDFKRVMMGVMPCPR